MDYVPESDIEKIVGKTRDERFHWGYADLLSQTITIMHSGRCLDMHKRGVRDMFDCPYSKAMQLYGIGDLPYDKPVILEVKYGELAVRNVPESDEEIEMLCAWTDYRKDYGVSEANMNAAAKAFKAGWKAAKEGPQDGVLR